MVLIGYAIGNAVSPFMWKKQYQPRYARLFSCLITLTNIHQCYGKGITSLGR